MGCRLNLKVMLKEFKPALFFLGKFLAIYVAGNLLYGIFVESFGKRPDSITVWITDQCSALLQHSGFNSSSEINPFKPTVLLKQDDNNVLNVFEGCNGVNVMIVFIAFLVAYGGPVKRILWFLPLGLGIIHGFNLLRIMLLYYTALYAQEFFYYLHKYFFTAILYLVVFIVWAVWIKLNVKTTKPTSD